jgi:hypothetical protein
MLGLLDRAAQLTGLKRETLYPEPLSCEAALETTALAATLLFSHGQTTERTVAAAEHLGHALGVTVTVLPYWGGNSSSRSMVRPSHTSFPPSHSVSTWAGSLRSRA